MPKNDPNFEYVVFLVEAENQESAAAFLESFGASTPPGRELVPGLRYLQAEESGRFWRFEQRRLKAAAPLVFSVAPGVSI
jgi:hypothetical protein